MKFVPLENANSCCCAVAEMFVPLPENAEWVISTRSAFPPRMTATLLFQKMEFEIVTRSPLNSIALSQSTKVKFFRVRAPDVAPES